MNWLEKHFRKYAISNLSLIVIICYGFGYVLQMVNSSFLGYLSLNPYAIVHGQIWRLFTWVLIPPDTSNIFFVIIAMIFYYQIGTALERTWGTWDYNVYIFSGLLYTVIGSFVNMGLCYLIYGNAVSAAPYAFFQAVASYYSTYYVTMSIFLAFAVTFPDMQVLLFFIIPVKVKWLGIIYAVILGVNLVQYIAAGAFYAVIAIVASLMNFLVLYLRSKKIGRFSPNEVRRKNQFRRAARTGRTGPSASPAKRIRPKKTVHRCAICGRTEADDPTLEFRYCSKCQGNYEFCQDHLFSHIHAANGQGPKPVSGSGANV